jgi:hypothetical protein
VLTTKYPEQYQAGQKARKKARQVGREKETK